MCAPNGIVVVVCDGLLTGVSRNGETHVHQGSPLLVFFRCTRLSRVCGRRVAAAAAAVVDVEEKEKSRIERIYRSP